MQINKLIKVLSLSLIAVVAWFIVNNSKPETKNQSPQLFIPELAGQLNQVSAIKIQNKEFVTNLTRTNDNKWLVVEKSNYPANMSNLRKMLLYLAGSEIRDKKTSDPLKFSKLNLDEHSGKKIQLFKDGMLMHDIMIGKINADGNATYVKKSGEPQTYLASGDLQFHANPAEWLDFNFVSINPERVQKITFQFSGKKPYQYERQSPNEKLELSPKPDDKLFKTDDNSRNPANYFERLSFTDILPSIKKTSNQQNITTLYTFDGLVISFEFHEIGYSNFVEIKATFDPKIRDEATNIAANDIIEEATKINEITSGWLYELGQFQQQNLRRSYMDLTTIKAD
jgi:hypothetical protein